MDTDRNLEDSQSFMSKVADSPYVAIRWTSISAAIDYSKALFEKSSYEGTRRVDDISSDGKNNRTQVIGDPGASMAPAESFQTFSEAVKSKLIHKIAGIAPGIHMEGDTQFGCGPLTEKRQDASV